MKDLLTNHNRKPTRRNHVSKPEIKRLKDTEVIERKIDFVFVRDGRRFRVSATGLGFVVGPDIKIEPGTPPKSYKDICIIDL